MTPSSTHVIVAHECCFRVLQRFKLRSHHDRKRHERFAFDHARQRFLAGRALAHALVDKHALDSAAMIVPDDQGAPRLVPYTGLTVSISHTGTWVAAAISASPRCGVDVQTKLSFDSYSSRVLQNFLPANWYSEIHDASDKDSFLTRRWVLLEAAVKWRGSGFSAPLNELSFKLTPAGMHVTDLLTKEETYIHVHELFDGSFIAVTHHGGTLNQLSMSIHPTPATLLFVLARK